MAMLAHKTSMPLGMGMGPTSVPRDYPSTSSSHRTQMSNTMHNGCFASPTESEFSEAFDGVDAVRYVVLSGRLNRAITHHSIAHGTRRKSQIG